MHIWIGCKRFIMFLTDVVFSATTSQRQLLKIAMFWFAGTWHKHFLSSLLSFILVFVFAQSHVSQNLLDLPDVKLNQWETSELCRVTSWKKNRAQRCLQFGAGWRSVVSGRVPAQSATMCLHSIVRVPLRSRTKSFSPWAAHVAQCNLKPFVTDNLHRVLRAFVSFPTVLQICNNATFQGQGYY